MIIDHHTNFLVSLSGNFSDKLEGKQGWNWLDPHNFYRLLKYRAFLQEKQSGQKRGNLKTLENRPDSSHYSIAFPLANENVRLIQLV